MFEAGVDTKKMTLGGVSTIHGGTKFALLLGHPVWQVKSPEPMNDWFAANSLDNVIVPADIRLERLASLVEAVRGAQQS